MRPLQNTAFALVLFGSITGFAGEHDKKIIVPPAPPEADKWKLLLAAPGWMAGLEGTVGLNGVNSNVNVGFDKILPKIDMIWASRAELSKGRFGVLGEWIYLSLSDGIGTDTVVKKVDVRVDESLADLTLRYRMIEGPKGYVDALAGVRYTNIYNALSLRPNDQKISQVAAEFTDEVSARIREQINSALSQGPVRTALDAAVRERITTKVAAITGPGLRARAVPDRALAQRTPGRLGAEIERLVFHKQAAVVGASIADLQAATAAEEAAAQQTGAADKAKLRAQAAALRARVEARIADAQQELEKKITTALQRNLKQDASLTEDWWDPYIGLRARYNFTPAIYAIGRGDIGGFDIGSDLMWQLEGALGIQLSRAVYAEFGYRALSFDYHKNGFLNDTIMHGAQITLGVMF